MKIRKEIGVDPNPPAGEYTVEVEGIASFMDLYGYYDGKDWDITKEWQDHRIWWYENEQKL